jgi:hypothetical protein
LANRHINTAVNCPVCNTDPEDLKHMLFRCDQGAEVSRELGILELVRKSLEVHLAGSTVLEELLCSDFPDEEQLFTETAFVLVSCWYIWWMRRKIKNNESTPIPRRAAMSIKGIVANNAKVKGQSNSVKRHGWCKPPPGVLKLNVDASYLVDSGT